jgi:hypothetical protein
VQSFLAGMGFAGAGVGVGIGLAGGLPPPVGGGGGWEDARQPRRDAALEKSQRDIAKTLASQHVGAQRPGSRQASQRDPYSLHSLTLLNTAAPITAMATGRSMEYSQGLGESGAAALRPPTSRELASDILYAATQFAAAGARNAYASEAAKQGSFSASLESLGASSGASAGLFGALAAPSLPVRYITEVAAGRVAALPSSQLGASGASSSSYRAAGASTTLAALHAGPGSLPHHSDTAGALVEHARASSALGEEVIARAVFEAERRGEAALISALASVSDVGKDVCSSGRIESRANNFRHFYVDICCSCATRI